MNEIQQSWEADGTLGLAKIAMAADLVFIGLFSLGGVIGGRLIRREAGSASLKKLAAFAVVAHISFGLLDYGETLSQFVQLMTEEGSDTLAAFAVAPWHGATASNSRSTPRTVELAL